MLLLALGSTIGVAIAYFLAARLGLALLTEGVAVFWPASGIAVGTLVTLGRRARAPVVIGVVAASIAANVVGDPNIWTSLFKGFCNAGGSVLTAWLIEQWFDGPFAFDDVRHVLGFVAAAGIGAVASAIAGAATVTLLYAPYPYWDVWRAWFLADGVGTVVVAPLVIGLGQLWRELPSRADSIEGAGVLTVFMPITMYTLAQPSGGWATYEAAAPVFPLLLWLTARCRPIFAIVAAFGWSITVIGATIFGVGQFGDASVPLTERVEGAQISVAVVTFCTLILSALFTERRRNEATLRFALGELDHRVKNMLAIVSAIVVRTQETSSSMAEFVAAIDGRIRSMATTHELLSRRHWHGLPLAELVRRILAPYAIAGSVRLEGPDDVVLNAEAGQTIAMVLHELATNAAKFGALSTKDGCVAVRWVHLLDEDTQGRLRIQWEESGGPTVRPQARSGYGTSVIRDLIPYELSGTVDIVRAADGLHCTLEIPARWLESPGAAEPALNG
jgi:two-component sensor histidine kinase/integral membrane sensor domain MASE1